MTVASKDNIQIENEARLYYFACIFLWAVISLFHYLVDMLITEKVEERYLKWSGEHEDLAIWIGNERLFLFDNEEIPANDVKRLLAKGEMLGDSLISRWGNIFNATASDLRDKYTAISESVWLYYCYCLFLSNVLKEFDRVLQGVNSSSVYYKRYQESIELFVNMGLALEREVPGLNGPDDMVDQMIWTEIDACASKLGEEWRQAVISAADNFELPKIDEEGN